MMHFDRIHPLALGIALGFIEGTPIFIATIILIFQGESGPAFLSKLFPFYEISWSGAFIGLVEGIVDGFIGGVIMAWIYNFVVRIIDSNKVLKKEK
jgi:hypothetical protein